MLGYNKYWENYGLDKIAAEDRYKKYAQEFGFKCDIIRSPYVYGEFNYARRESFVFEHLLRNKPIIIPRQNSKIQFIYVKDLAEIIIRLLEVKEEQDVNVYNVGNR